MEVGRTLFEGRHSTGAGRGTASEHYRRFAKAGVPGYVLDEKPPEEDAPEEFAHLLTWYSDIRARQERGQHYEPIGLMEIEAYERRLNRLGIEMEPLDFELLCRLDGVWQESVPKPDGSSARPQRQGGKPR